MHPVWLITNSRSGRLQLNNTGTYELGRQFPEVSDRTGNFAIENQLLVFHDTISHSRNRRDALLLLRCCGSSSSK